MVWPFSELTKVIVIVWVPTETIATMLTTKATMLTEITVLQMTATVRWEGSQSFNRSLVGKRHTKAARNQTTINGTTQQQSNNNQPY